MPYYDFRNKPPRRDSVGPEEGYRPHGRRADKPDGNARRTREDARPGKPGGDARRTRDDARPDAGPSGKGGPRRREPLRSNAPSGPSRRPMNQDGPKRPVTPPRRQAPPPPPPREPRESFEDLPPENMLVGRNPIREALKSGRDFEKLLVARGDLAGSAREIVSMARERHIIVQEVDRARLDALSPNHQGLVAFASAYRYATVEDMFARATERNEAPFLILLDGITDPHNLGAIIRTAECAGAHGVILPERRAVGLTPAAVKASAGAIEYLPVARTGNLTRLIDELKQRGVWIYAACMDGSPYDQADLSGPVALVIGGEGTGVSRLVAEHCDHRLALPLRGKIESLNASVAAGILMYEVARRRKP